MNWAGKFERAFELLQILHDMILEYKKRDIDFSIAKIRPVRTELFVRYNRRYEKRVCEVLDLVYRRWGYERLIWDRKSKKNARDDVKYLYRVHLVLNKTKIHIKTYRRKNFKEDSSDFWDDPKLEISVYFGETDTLEEVRQKTELGKSLLASVVYLAKISDALIYEDTYATSLAYATDAIVKSLFVTSVELKEMYSDLIRDELDEYLLDYLTQSSINTDDTKYIAELFNTTSRTVRRRLEKFIRAGIVEQYRIRKTYFWVLRVGELDFKDEIDIDYVKQRILEEFNYEIDDTSARILHYIDRGHVTTTQLSRVLKLSRRTVQRYLSALVVAGIVSAERKGKVVKYSLNFEL
ncbi:helix-turn-helix domain-containing protein [Thermococcus sp. 21S9]|uniref:winged helix-turn-helix transcriptional regulator n=2 Tax=unclassified Thermococcus TaxID=2627626 RepID=UPI00143B5426